jgi:hypothetical protein
MYNFILMEYGKIQIQTLTHEYHDYLVPDFFQNFMSKLVQDMEYLRIDTLSLCTSILELTLKFCILLV